MERVPEFFGACFIRSDDSDPHRLGPNGRWSLRIAGAYEYEVKKYKNTALLEINNPWKYINRSDIIISNTWVDTKGIKANCIQLVIGIDELPSSDKCRVISYDEIYRILDMYDQNRVNQNYDVNNALAIAVRDAHQLYGRKPNINGCQII